MSNREECPRCKRSLVSEEGCSLGTSVEVRGVYDGGLFYVDSEHNGGCGFAWHRWENSGINKPLHIRAQPYIDKWNAKRFEESK